MRSDKHKQGSNYLSSFSFHLTFLSPSAPAFTYGRTGHSRSPSPQPTLLGTLGTDPRPPRRARRRPEGSVFLPRHLIGAASSPSALEAAPQGLPRPPRPPGPALRRGQKGAKPRRALRRGRPNRRAPWRPSVLSRSPCEAGQGASVLSEGAPSALGAACLKAQPGSLSPSHRGTSRCWLTCTASPSPQASVPSDETGIFPCEWDRCWFWRRNAAWGGSDHLELQPPAIRDAGSQG